MFIDSSAATSSLIKCYSASVWSTAIAGCFWEKIGTLDASCWITQIPSKFNLADAISRHDFVHATQFQWKHTETKVPQLGPWRSFLSHQSSGAGTISIARRHRQRQVARQGR